MSSEQQTKSIDEILKSYWGYDSFRPLQREIIERVMSGCDTLALLPTGGGKSLTYQVPALAMDGLTVVVTPLIALMQDQVGRLRRMGIPARAIYSGLTMDQLGRAIDDCIYGDVKLLYISPERLASEPFKARLRSAKISLIAVDEAHCISQWGYDFRPSYMNIGLWRNEFPDVPLLALTATATQRVCKDIMRRLYFGAEGDLLCGSFERKNLSYVVRKCDDKMAEIEKILTNVGGSVIIYTRTRSACEQVSEEVVKMGFSSTAYHAGLEYDERQSRQQQWVEGQCRVMVATNAFGMGIDKGDVRVVIHLSMCDSLEAYTQEAGRAGRDGVRSYAVLLVSHDDDKRIIKSINDEFPELDTVRNIYERLCQAIRLEYGAGEGLTTLFSTSKFCYQQRISEVLFKRTMKILELNNYCKLSDEALIPARILFAVSRHELYMSHFKSPLFECVVDSIMRLYDGIFTTFQAIDVARIASECGQTERKVSEVLQEMSRLRLIDYLPSTRSEVLKFISCRVERKDVYIAPETYLYRRDSYQNSFQRMVRYAECEDECRSKLLAEYFEVDVNLQSCGICDNCLSKRKK